jgi:hypothetical protein
MSFAFEKTTTTKEEVNEMLYQSSRGPDAYDVDGRQTELGNPMVDSMNKGSFT